MKKTLTTLLTLALVAVFALLLVACDDNSGNTIPTPPASEKDNTYKQSDFVVEWGDDDAKKDVLENTGMTEEQFKQFYNGFKMSMTFSADRVSVNAPGCPSEDGSSYSKSNLYYSIAEDGSITFYETATDKENNTAFTDDVFFMNKFVISNDYTTIRMMNNLSHEMRNSAHRRLVALDK